MSSPYRVHRRQYDKENLSPNIHKKTPIKYKTIIVKSRSNRENSSRSTTPLSCSRDPLRNKVLHKTPFAPYSDGKRQFRKIDRRRKRRGGSSNEFKRPAYAYIDPQTGEFKLSFEPPKVNDIDIVESGDRSVPFVPALYPITVNGGGFGVYTDPRDFAAGGFNNMSQNRHESTNAPNRSCIAFPWNMGNESYSDEKKKQMMNNYDANNNHDKLNLYEALEAGLKDELEEGLKDHGDRMQTKWKNWESIHNFLSKRFYEGQTSDRSLEINESGSPFSLPTHHQKARMSGLYNDDDFDFAIILEPKEAYSYWANILDFREENGYIIENEEEENGDAYKTPTSKRRRPLGNDDLQRSTSYGFVYNRGERNDLTTLFHKALAKITPPRSSKKRTSPIRSLARKIREYHSDTTSLGTPTKNQLLRGSESKKRSRNNDTPHPEISIVGGKHNANTRDMKRRKKISHRLEIKDIPNQFVPRGIAVRTNGMAVFLSALKEGIVVRRLRPHRDPIFVQLLSSDGGDTIQYKYMLAEDSYTAFRAQGRKYNKGDVDRAVWSANEKTDSMSFTELIYKSSLSSGWRTKLSNKTTKVLLSGSFKAKDIIAVHPGKAMDPLSEANENGTSSLRETINFTSKQYHESVRLDMNKEEQRKYMAKRPSVKRTFSIILPRNGMKMSRKLGAMIDGSNYLKLASVDWNEGDLSDRNLSFLDLEAATVGEYWMVLRGFVLLQRDAMNDRFAAERNGGFGSNSSRQQKGQVQSENEKIIKFHEPEEKHLMHSLCCMTNNDSSLTETENPEDHEPPPSDFFLGFESPGTKIWSRLRQAGLETKRIYDLDKKIVMIKIKCPPRRLTQIAEVLRLNTSITSNFRSSIRQNIIDHIINSRFVDHIIDSEEREERDTGADLSAQSKLGKCIKFRTPLHMHADLEALYTRWYKEMPSLFKRLFMGYNDQPLDEIKDYFGEHVAFHFAWLQHCSHHLRYMSALGFLVFIYQLNVGYDHALRPYFSAILMIWSFFVLVTWRKQQNFLAHQWGTLNHTQEETTRPQFQGKLIRNKKGQALRCDITGDLLLYYPSWKRWLKHFVSIPITLAFTVGSLLAVLIFHANRDIALARYLSGDENEHSIYDFNWSLSAIGEIEAIGAVTLSQENLRDFRFWYIICGLPCALGLSLPLLNFILMRVSRVLNNFENHRTESQYRNALITKVFAFRFVTYFSAIYYYSYISIGKDYQTVQNSFLRVSTSLVIYLTVAQWWAHILGIFFPLIIFRWRLYKKGIKLGDELREIESLELERSNVEVLDNSAQRKLNKRIANRIILLEQAQMKVWEEIMFPDYDPFYDYVLAVLYFTFVTCFSAVLPILPLIVLINQFMNMRLQAYKICRSRRRPLAQKTGGVSSTSNNHYF